MTGDQHYTLLTDDCTTRTEEKSDHVSGLWYLNEEDLLDKHKVQLLAVSFNPGHGEIDYTRTTYSSCSKNPDLYDCAFDRFDKQAQQFTVDKDQINFSILIITGSTRRCRYGLAKYITKILLCNLPP